MSTNGKRLKWTQNDQRALDQLVERKAAFEQAHRVPLEGFVRDTIQPHTGINSGCADSVAKWLIHNADTIRDLLLPFDSGVRGPDAAEG